MADIDTHTPGPWAFYGPSSGSRVNDDGGDYGIYVEYDGERHIIAEAFRRTAENNMEPSQANAKLIVRLANLYFAGTERAEKHEAEVLANGDIPADPDYGLTENEVASARMLNASMDEITSLKEVNAELAEALRLAQSYLNVSLGSPTWDGPNPYPIIETALAKAKGDNSQPPTPPTDDCEAVAAMEAR